MTIKNLITAVILSSICLSCGSNSNQNNDSDASSKPSVKKPEAKPETKPNPPENSTPVAEVTVHQPDSIVPAEGWTHLTVYAYSSKTLLDSFTHFSTTMNGCGRPASGVLDHEDTNSITANLNAAVTAETATTPYCVPSTELFQAHNDKVEVTVFEGEATTKKTIYEIKDEEICTTIGNKKIANELLKSVLKLIVTADKQDVDYSECPWAKRHE